jgi:UDP-galactopyranose mutase
MNEKIIVTENQKVLNFITNFQSKNEFKNISIDPYNEKFRIEFDFFLIKNNFSKETIKLFK